MRDTPDKRRKAYLPYTQSWFNHLYRRIADAAGLPQEITFRCFRHGGLTELGDSEATERKMVSLGGHETPSMVYVYSRRTARRIRNAARKRLALRLTPEPKQQSSQNG